MVDMGPISFYLGLKVERNCQEQTIKLLQPFYIDKVPSKFHFDKANVAPTLMKKSALLLPCTDGEATTAEKR